MLDQLMQEGKLKQSSWMDDMGHCIHWMEFESMDAFAKLYAVEAFHQRRLVFPRLVDNLRVRLLQPAQLSTS